MAQAMADADLDVCMIEESWKFPTPAQLLTFAAEWHALGGVLATSFREPWGRFRSNYLREHGYARATNLTIAQYAKRSYAQTPTGGEVVKSVAHNILKYGAYNRPNFYVRLLNGRAEPPGQDSKMGPGELKSALSGVAHIYYVFLLEGDLQPKVRRAMLGRDVERPHVSNSFFSARAVASYPERLKQMPPTDHYKPKFLEANCADLSFYYALVNKLRAEKLCKGCAIPPHRFFRGSEAHPRPRCFNVADEKPHPSLWAQMTALWRGAKENAVTTAIYLETHE